MAARAIYAFSVSRIGDLLQATLAFDSLHRCADRPFVLVVAPEGKPLVERDPRVRVEVVASSHRLVWRLEVLRHLLAARAVGARVVNFEIYEPRWRFICEATRYLRLEASHLDLPRVTAERLSAMHEKRVQGSLHISAHYAAAAGLHGDPPPLHLVVPPAAHALVDSRLGERARGPGPLVVVHPGSSPGWAAKRVPVTILGSMLAAMATDWPGLVAVVIGTSAERALCAEVLAAAPAVRAVSLAGEVPLWALPALLQRARLFIGGDSGPLKIAEAVGTRSLSFWGPTPAALYGPRGRAHRVVEMQPPCAPCFELTCTAPSHCLSEIDPRRVAAIGVDLIREAMA